MLKISLVEEGHSAVKLRLEGRVAGPWVEELKEVCAKLLGKGCRPELNLSGVSFVDDAGAELLSRFRAEGLVLADCSPFVAAQLNGAGA